MPSQQLIDIIIKATDQASSVANKVDSSIQKIGESGGMLSRIPGFDKLSGKISQVGQTIKGKLSPYVDSARQKLQNLSNGAKGFGNILGPLKGALSMTVGMIGYDLVNGLVAAARASINANSQLDYFGKRLNMTASETTKFRGEIDSLQKEFRKVDMTAVGATAEEMAVKFNLPKQSIGDLTRMTAVLSSTFVKEGRSQEDAILAVSDALDGQFKRLQEIGITQQTLKDNGWNGNLEDQDSLIKALNKSMQEMGYEQTAKDITNLDEAWGALTIAGGQLLQKVLVPITPIIIRMVDALLKVADAVGPVISAFTSMVANMPDWAKFAGLAVAFAIAVTEIASYISLTLVPALAAATLGALDFAAALLANPLTWVAIAIVAIAAAVYEVGKAFGWWDSVGGMLSAIWAGIQRLWSAFINHPDVQAIVSAMSNAWNVLSSAIGKVINWVKSFFNVSAPSNFDVVRALINALGIAWKMLTVPIRTVIKIIQTLYGVFKEVYSRGKANLDKLRAVIAGLPGSVRGAISSLLGVLTSPFKSAYGKIKGTIDSIKNVTRGITNVNISSVTSKLTQPFVNAYNKIKGYVDQIKAKANSIPVIGGAFGFDYEGMLAAGGGSSTMTLDQNITLTVDLANVPPGVDTETLIAALTDRTVLAALTSNSDFQSLDSKAKNKLTLKQGRARGV